MPLTNKSHSRDRPPQLNPSFQKAPMGALLCMWAGTWTGTQAMPLGWSEAAGSPFPAEMPRQCKVQLTSLE